MTGRWTRLAWALAGLAVLGALDAGAERPIALVNESLSLPRGLYLLAPTRTPRRGAVAAFAQPAGARAYLAQLGAPPEMQLLKRVSAVAGDRVCHRDGTIEVAGHVLPVATHDRRATALPAWRDCRRLAAGEVFMLGDTRESFDSRHFGPVEIQEITGVYEGVLSW